MAALFLYHAIARSVRGSILFHIGLIIQCFGRSVSLVSLGFQGCFVSRGSGHVCRVVKLVCLRFHGVSFNFGLGVGLRTAGGQRKRCGNGAQDREFAHYIPFLSPLSGKRTRPYGATTHSNLQKKLSSLSLFRISSAHREFRSTGRFLWGRKVPPLPPAFCAPARGLPCAPSGR